MLLLSYSNVQFYLFLVYFFIAIFVAFFIPGLLIFSRYKITLFQKIIISTLYGIVLWAFQALIVNYLHAQWLTYCYLLACCISFVFLLRKQKRYVLLFRRHMRAFLVFLQH